MALFRRAQLLKRVASAVALGLLVLGSAILSHAQTGALVSQRNLAELVDEAGIIIRGRVVSTRVEPHPQYPALMTVVVTLQVDETLKGQVGETYTFRQFIWDARDTKNAAGYSKASSMLLLLLPPNGNGLSSPAGLEQGRFRLTTDASGRTMAANGQNNAGLFDRVAPQAAAKGTPLTGRAAALATTPPASGPAALDDLRDMIRQLASANQ